MSLRGSDWAAVGTYFVFCGLGHRSHFDLLDWRTWSFHLHIHIFWLRILLHRWEPASKLAGSWWRHLWQLQCDFLWWPIEIKGSDSSEDLLFLFSFVLAIRPFWSLVVILLVSGAFTKAESFLWCDRCFRVHQDSWLRHDLGWWLEYMLLHCFC